MRFFSSIDQLHTHIKKKKPLRKWRVRKHKGSAKKMEGTGGERFIYMKWWNWCGRRGRLRRQKSGTKLASK